MEQHTCSVLSCGVAVNFVSSVDLYPHFNNLAAGSYIPNIEVREGWAEGRPVLLYTDTPKNTRFCFAGNQIEVEYPWAMMRAGETLLYLSYPLMELQRQEQSDLTAHAACVSHNGEGILLLGKEGSGKTSVAIDLCRKHGARLVANDLCVLGSRGSSVIARGGTRFLFLRRESIERNLPDLLGFFTRTPTDPWLDKVKVANDEIGVRCEEAEVKVRSAFMLHVDETKTTAVSMPADSLVTRLYLNENFSRYIRSSCTVMLGGSDFEYLEYIPSLDREAFFFMRRRLMTGVIRGCALEYVSGPLGSVLEHVTTSHQERVALARATG